MVVPWRVFLEFLPGLLSQIPVHAEFTVVNSCYLDVPLEVRING